MYVTQRFTGPLDPVHWSVFEDYASRIRVISFSDTPSQLDDSVIPAIAVICLLKGNSTPFSSLETLNVVAQAPETLQNSLAFLSPKLRHIALTFWNIQVHVFLQQITLRSPYLGTLHLNGRHVDLTNMIPQLDECIQALPKLITITLPFSITSSPPIWSTLSVASNLKNIRHYSSGESNILDNYVRFNEDSFSTLEQIEFELQCDTATTLFSRLVPSSLLVIIARLKSVDAAAAVAGFLDSVAANAPLLKRFYLHHSTAGYPLDITHVSPILRHGVLTHLIIDVPDVPNISDDEISTISSALPDLHSISFCAKATGTPRFTLRALIPFARSCPRLHTVSIYVDTSNPPPPRNPQLAPAFMCPDLTLDFGWSTVATMNAWKVALFLSEICPDETTICGDRTVSAGETPQERRIQSATSKEWEEVVQAFKVLRAYDSRSRKNKTAPSSPSY